MLIWDTFGRKRKVVLETKKIKATHIFYILKNIFSCYAKRIGECVSNQ